MFYYLLTLDFMFYKRNKNILNLIFINGVYDLKFLTNFKKI